MHEYFKTFVGTTLNDAISKAEQFTIRNDTVAIKSISVLVHDKTYILSLGFTLENPGHNVRIEVLSLGNFNKLIINSLTIDSSLENASEESVICHSLFYDTDSDDLQVVFLHLLE